MWRFLLAVVVGIAPLTCWAQPARDPRPVRPPLERPAPMERPAPIDKAPLDPAGNEIRKEIDLNAQIVEWEITIAEWRLPSADEAGADATTDDLEGPAAEVKQRVAALAKAGKLQVLQRMRLHSLEGVEAYLRFGGRRPQISSSQVTNFGQQNQLVYQEIGTLLSITSRVKDDVVFAQLDLNKTDLSSPPDAPAISETKAGEKIRASSIYTLAVRTSLKAVNGQTVLVTGLSDRSERHLMLATPRLLK